VETNQQQVIELFGITLGNERTAAASSVTRKQENSKYKDNNIGLPPGGDSGNAGANLVGTWIVSFEYQGKDYAHGMHITSQQNNGAIKGNGGYPEGKPYNFAWTITTGALTASNIEFIADYTLGALGTTMHVAGRMAKDGSMSGTWTDNHQGQNRRGTWKAQKRGN
jgi:hypothetical protein